MTIAAAWTEQVLIPVRKKNGETLNVLGMVAAEAPGLAVTPTIGSDVDVAKYAVTHIASGFRVGLFNDLDSAKRYLLSLAPVADWTIGGEQLRADPVLGHRIWAMRCAAPGTVL